MKTVKIIVVLSLVMALVFSALGFAEMNGSGRGRGPMYRGGDSEVPSAVSIDEESFYIFDSTSQQKNTRTKTWDLPLFDKYTPEIYEDMLALYDEHLEIHLALDVAKTSLQEDIGPGWCIDYQEDLNEICGLLEENKIERDALRVEIKAAIEAGDTFDEIKLLVLELADLWEIHVGLDQDHLDLLNEILDDL